MNQDYAACRSRHGSSGRARAAARAAVVVAAALLVSSTCSGVMAQQIPSAKLPVVFTSGGQSSAILIVNAVADSIGLKYDYYDICTAEEIAMGVGFGGAESGPGCHVESKSGVKPGTPFKTIVIGIGASLKGMGASGLSVDEEVDRLKKIVAYCREKNIFIIGVHVEGKSKRGKPGSDNERMIDAVAPYAGFLIVTADSNFDGRFTAIAEKNNIPLSTIKQAADMGPIFKKLFGLGN